MNYFRFLRENAPFLLAGVLLTFCSSFGQTFFISVFAGAIRDEFGLSHGAWGGLYTLGTTASAIVMVWAGGLTDHYRARALGKVVLILLALACLSMAFTPAVWFLPIAIFLLRLAGQGMTVHIAVVSMARWFVATRGRALSTAGLGVALGEAFLPLFFVALLTVSLWRWLWVGTGLFILAMLPVLARLLRLERTPQSVANDNQSVGMDAVHWTRQRVLSHWLFWLLVPALMAPAAFSTAFFFQQVHLAETKGWTHVELVALFPLFTACAVGSMIVSGWVIDRVGTARLMPVFQLPMALGFVVMAQASSLAMAAGAMILMGLTQGANSTVPNAFWAEFYGTRFMGGIKALATAVMVFGTAIGPGLTGVLIDRGVIFEDQLYGIAAYFVTAALLVLVGITRARGRLTVAA
ncbi:MFS transporter [Anianabacter salinae]|uniref:MFS transporter n=1 Tax=Anianabacter salinae TaxID=2851023 RepID=UPI00225E3B98|nr:MFS transporter [Anianabacter salinae]MBV0913503.1 MFS transporter [Anianabacter salinae]